MVSPRPFVPLITDKAIREPFVPNRLSRIQQWRRQVRYPGGAAGSVHNSLVFGNHAMDAESDFRRLISRAESL